MSSPSEPHTNGARPGAVSVNGAGRNGAGGDAELALSQALALGVLHGPAELMPISSSGHMALIPWLMRWDYAELDPDLRKAFEVVLHAGTAAALLITLRGEVQDTLAVLTPRLAAAISLSAVPPALVGFGLERQIERHLGTPATIAAGLIGGALAMAWADRNPQERRSEQAGLADGLWLGIAQACALAPGVSRNGATLVAARRRRFTRTDANKLSRHVALPVIGGATLLKSLRLARRGLPPGTTVPMLAGAASAFVSTLASTWVIGQVERDRSLLPYSLYRLALGGAVVRRLIRDSG